MPFIFYDGKTGRQYTLPGLYQPIYGHPEFDGMAQRNCRDRLEHICKVYDALEKELQRPLRVLDLGCNQGFISFTLAARGGAVTGIEVDETRVKFCNLLAEENPGLKIKFLRARIEDFVPAVQPNEYDLVIAMSVLHYPCMQYGWQKVQAMLSDLAKKVNGAIFELALNTEPHNWYGRLPGNFFELIAGFSFARTMACITHSKTSGAMKRPLCFASSRYAYLESSGMLKIDSVKYHSGVHINGRMYFHCGDKFVKVGLVMDYVTFERYQKEIRFLKKFGGQNSLPKLYETCVEPDDTGIYRFFIVTDKIFGVTLSEKIKNLSREERFEILKKVLRDLAFFEENGYRNFDIHLGNFLYTDSGKVIPVDYELFSDGETDILSPFPRHPAIQFFHFANTLLEYLPETSFLRTPKFLTYFKKNIGDKKFSRIMRIKDSEKYFARLYEILFESDDETFDGYTMSELELLAVEDYLKNVGKKLKEYESEIDSINRKIGEQQKELRNLKKD